MGNPGARTVSARAAVGKPRSLNVGWAPPFKICS